MQIQDAACESQLTITDFECWVHEVLTVFCCIAWSHAPSSLQRNYPKFAMHPDELRLLQHVHAERVADGTGISVEIARKHILDPLVRINEIYDSRWRSPRVSGVILRDASYARCMLGGVPDFGDVAYAIRCLQKEYEGEPDLTPERVFQAYKEGDPVTLHMLLNCMLENACEEISALVLAPGGRNVVSHAPSMWYLDAESSPILDMYVVDTEYHLFTALLRFVEHAVGTA